MIWIVIGIAAAVILGIFTFLALRPMAIPRQPEREGEQKGQAVTDYAAMAGGLLFRFERFLVLRGAAKLKPAGTALDIGCGPGYLATALKRHYPSLKMIGLDINAEMLGFARAERNRRHLHTELVQADAGLLPLAADSLDLVVTSLSLHHWKEPQAVFNEIARVLKPGGRLLVFDLRRNSPHLFYWAIIVGQVFSPSSIDRTNGGVGSFWSSYTPSELEKILAPAAFREFKVESHSGWMIISARK